MPSIVTLISGRGSNFEAIVKTAQNERWHVKFTGVIANHEAAKGLDFARSQGIPTFVIDAPGGGGKIPLLPNYVVEHTDAKIVLRNYKGVLCEYPEK